jgi:molecular chaperone GrpE
MHKKKEPTSSAGGNDKTENTELKETKQTAPECDCVQLEASYKRALADYQNLLKQTAKDKEEYYKFASEQILYELLPVYDNLKMSFAHCDETASQNGWHKGIEYIIKQFADALTRIGVEEVKTEGEPFDYHSMEAVEKITTEDEAKNGLVERLIKSGYKLHGKVIAPARVTVYEYNGSN